VLKKENDGKALQAVDYFSIKSPLRSVASNFSLRARKRMYKKLVSLLNFNENRRIIDVGVTPDEALFESNFFERYYPHRGQITATSIEDASNIEKAFPGVRFVQTHGDRLPFEEDTFDIAVSFAVLEHVGTRERQRSFISEMLRVAPIAFITTPDRAFPVELHTFLPVLHWLPQKMHQRALTLLGHRFWARTENLNLLYSKELVSIARSLGAEVELHKHKTFGLSSNLLLVLRR
jgi:hypothetical protein